MTDPPLDENGAGGNGAVHETATSAIQGRGRVGQA